MAAKDMTGWKFGKLTVLERIPNAKDGTAKWECVCECGERRQIAGTGLRAGRHKSCGCSSPRFQPEHTTLHGMSKSRTYLIWLGMRQRCSDAAIGKSRRLYYLKGIRVCDRWQDFECFLADMGEAPSWGSIDRIDGTKGYSPDNCRWATRREQANNTASNRLITFDGETMTLSLWAEKLGVKPNTLLHRLRRGLPLDRAMSQGIGNIRTQRKQERERPCAVCGAMFTPRPSQLRQGAGQCCSHPCAGRRVSETNRQLEAA